MITSELQLLNSQITQVILHLSTERRVPKALGKTDVTGSLHNRKELPVATKQRLTGSLSWHLASLPSGASGEVFFWGGVDAL